MKAVAPGIWKISFGDPEQITPVGVNSNTIQKTVSYCDSGQNKIYMDFSKIHFKTAQNGCILELPLKASERIYGFGLQLKSHNQTGKKKQLRTNADPIADSGDSHAPVPFYVSTEGYGVFVDTARYVSFYCGSSKKLENGEGAPETRKADIANNTEDLYTTQRIVEDRTVLIELPVAKGMDVYFFEGPDMKTAVQRYNLFSGGGCIPPIWGLGILYRMYGRADRKAVEDLAEGFRKNKIPCDMIGLEPGWQSHSYSCSYVWDDERFQQHEEMLKGLKQLNYHINLWEHVFVHPSSPIYEALKPFSGDYEVWGGLVPDLRMREASVIFSDYHRKYLVEQGIDSFKLDECDSSDYTGGWSFPNSTEFPSGMDGELMHSLLGILYQKTILSATDSSKRRTFGQVRSSHALAAPLPFVLYSDLYEHKDFIRGLVNAGFSGILWTPEVRQCKSVEDLIRRLQTVIFSPQVCINSWMIPNPPWFQYDYEKNQNGEHLDNWQEVQELCSSILKLRMRFIPYLYSCFHKYHSEGLPPFRALVMDYPGDENTYDIDDQFIMGEGIIVAPVTAGSCKRNVYLPEGEWYCFWTNSKYSGHKIYEIEAKLEHIPIFVKTGTILPLADPVEYVSEDTCFDITVYCYGNSCSDFILFEDDGISYEYKNGLYNSIKLSYRIDGGYMAERIGNFEGMRYKINKWVKI